MSEDKTVELSIQCFMCEEVTVIKVRAEDYNKFISPDRPHIQDIFPYLTPAERELLISKTCSKCWDSLFPDEE